MMRLGEEKELARGAKKVGKHEIEKIQLTKWMPTGEYQVIGLCADYAEDGTRLGAAGWCTLFGGTLKEARAYAESL
ncbi:MAG: hypothetical protein LUG99_09100 [Lachnospiraceae bacterium]|nr:hypothetical protein [Lachnospiraceae bacterium]